MIASLFLSQTAHVQHFSVFCFPTCSWFLERGEPTPSTTGLLSIAQQTWICSTFRTSFIRFKSKHTEVFLLSMFIISVWHYRTLFFVSEESNLWSYEETDFWSYKFLRFSQLKTEGVSIMFYPKAVFLDYKVYLPQEAVDIFRVTHVMTVKGHFSVSIH